MLHHLSNTRLGRVNLVLKLLASRARLSAAMCLYRMYIQYRNVRRIPIGAHQDRLTTSGKDNQSQHVYHRQAQARAGDGWAQLQHNRHTWLQTFKVNRAIAETCI